MTMIFAPNPMSPVWLAGLFSVALSALPGIGLAQHDGDDTTLDAVQAEFADAFAAMGEFTADQRDAALAEMAATLARLDARIDETEARARDEWVDMSQATRDRTAAALRALRERRNRLSASYGALSQGAATAWGDLMAGIQDGWADLETAWDEAATAMNADTETQTQTGN